MARLERMGGLWHQSVKVTAKMIPWHTVAGGLLDWWVSPACGEHPRAYVVLLPGLQHPTRPTPPNPPILTDEECSDRKGCRMGKEIKSDISTPSPDLVRIVLFLPRTIIQSPFYLFSAPTLPQRFLFQIPAAALRELPFMRRPAHGRFTGDTSDHMHVQFVPAFSFNILCSFCTSRQFYPVDSSSLLPSTSR